VAAAGLSVVTVVDELSGLVVTVSSDVLIDLIAVTRVVRVASPSKSVVNTVVVTISSIVASEATIAPSDVWIIVVDPVVGVVTVVKELSRPVLVAVSVNVP
jgi:hypothetical protein